MGNTLATDTIPVLVTMVDVHNPKSQDMFYFCNVGSGGAATKVIGRSQTLSVEVGITTVLSLIVYECPEPVFTPETARCLGVLRIPIERLAERYSSGIFQQWFNLDTRTDPRAPAGEPQALVSRFEQSYTDAVMDVYQPKVCISIIGSAFEVQAGSRSAFNIFVGEDVKTQAGPDLKALIASHKQQAAYIDALHEELRRLNMPSYRPMAAGPFPESAVPYKPAQPMAFPGSGPPMQSGMAPMQSGMAPMQSGMMPVPSNIAPGSAMQAPPAAAAPQQLPPQQLLSQQLPGMPGPVGSSFLVPRGTYGPASQGGMPVPAAVPSTMMPTTQ